MKKLIVLLLLVIHITVFAQSEKGYFQQKVDFEIEVTLNDGNKTLDGYVNMRYQNNSGDTLHYIWFHLWPNAFKNDRTAFSEQLLQNGRTDFYFSSEEKRGFINRLDFKVNNLNAVLEDHPQYIDVARLILPEPLAPGGKVSISTPFHVKLPFNFSRGGYVDGTFQITQWYPKPAVYDLKGWHPMPYLDQGEFYSEFGDFDVKITVPEEYLVAATGKEIFSQRNERDTEQALKPKKSTTTIKTPQIERKNQPLIRSKSSTKPLKEIDPNPSGRTVTYHFIQENIHDFAWFADKGFIVKQDTLLLESGRVIDILAYHTPAEKDVWKNSISFLKDAIITRSKWLGEYPYSTIKAVETKMAFSGGMEYPTITNIAPVEDEKSLDLIIQHEVGHNWNYGILASNEREHPWMDEGINSYYDNRYEAMKYSKVGSGFNNNFFSKRLPNDLLDMAYRTTTINKNDQPIETPSTDFSEMNYHLIAYHKTALWMKELENYLGRTVLDRSMQEFYQRWKFRHPYPSDFKKVIEDVSGQNVDSLFSILNTKGFLTPSEKKKLKLSSFFSFKDTDKYNYVFVAPAVGLNYYDKLMIGGIIHNYTLPKPKFHFFAAPMFGTGSNKFTGIGRVGYDFMSYGPIRKTEISFSASKFTMDAFRDSTGTNNYMGFHKLVPGIKFIFRNNDARSNMTKYIQWKTYFIEETGLLFSRDTVNHIDIISYPKTNRYLNQLTLSLSNDRALYPYSGKIIAEQGKGFARIAFDGNYYFNYAKGGGMDVRFFAGKFIYLGDRTISNKYQYRRYHLNMTGPNGYEDYTYSNYFVGRNEFNTTPSQQIMIRDGGFKVRTDMLNKKVGQSDDWLTALNFKTDFPKDLNPLEVLPINIPLKLFVDVGTYSEAWTKNASTEKFIFDAGIQVSLFKEMVNIYVPLIYSKVYGQYFKSTIPKEERFWKNISFSIDIQKFNFYRFLDIPEL